MIDETPIIYIHEFICYGYTLPDIPDAPACFVPAPIPISLCLSCFREDTDYKQAAIDLMVSRKEFHIKNVRYIGIVNYYHMRGE